MSILIHSIRHMLSFRFVTPVQMYLGRLQIFFLAKVPFSYMSWCSANDQPSQQPLGLFPSPVRSCGAITGEVANRLVA